MNVYYAVAAGAVLLAALLLPFTTITEDSGDVG